MVFQSAGRIIGWLNFSPFPPPVGSDTLFQSAGRIIGWLNRHVRSRQFAALLGFNPPGGLLVG